MNTRLGICSLLLLSMALLWNAPSHAAKSASLTWDAVPGATSYKVYSGVIACSNPAPLLPVVGGTALTPSFFDVSIPDTATDVCYEVTALNSVGESLHSTRAGKTFAMGSVSMVPSSAIAFTALVGDAPKRVPLVTVTNNMNVPVTAVWADAWSSLTQMQPGTTATIPAGGSVAFTILYTPAATAGTTTQAGTMTITPTGGTASVTTFTMTATVVAPTPPPAPTNLKVTQVTPDQIKVAGLVGVCTSLKTTGTGLNRYINCIH